MRKNVWIAPVTTASVYARMVGWATTAKLLSVSIEPTVPTMEVVTKLCTTSPAIVIKVSKVPVVRHQLVLWYVFGDYE